jgi:esterase
MKLFFRVYGEGQPLIILHGLLGSSDNWLTQAKFLSASYKVYTVDLRNHGQSPHDPAFDYEVMVRDLDEFLVEHQISNPVIIGHSMGGKTAMNFALIHPDKIQRLIVVDIAPRAYNLEHYALVEALSALPLDTITSRNEADTLLAQQIPDASVRQFLLKNLQRNQQGGFTWKINLPVIRNKLSNVGADLLQSTAFNKPTLFIRGAKSNYVKDSDRETILKIFPKAEIKTLDTGHWVQAEAPQQFVDTVMDWLKDNNSNNL